MAKLLEIINLHASIGGKEILKGLNLVINEGETHAIMGPNGAGKSTLSAVLTGNPAYEVTDGEVLLRGENLLAMEPEIRARAGVSRCQHDQFYAHGHQRETGLRRQGTAFSQRVPPSDAGEKETA